MCNALSARLTFTSLTDIIERVISKYLTSKKAINKDRERQRNMKICIFGAASEIIDDVYISETEKLAEKMAKRGHSLVFGAGATGVMGAAARGTKRGGGYICGVIPEFFREEKVEKIYLDCDEIIYTQSMAERKAKMGDEADAFIIAPGGIGTLEEFYEVLTLKQLKRHNKAVAVFNIGGYYDAAEKFMADMALGGFITEKCRQMYAYFTDADKLLDYLERYVPDNVSADELKNSE